MSVPFLRRVHHAHPQTESFGLPPRSGTKPKPSGAGSVWKGGARKRADDAFFAISIKRRGRKANFARKESGTYRYDFCPLKGVNRREAAAPNWSPAKRVQFGSEEQQNERAMNFVMK